MSRRIWHARGGDARTIGRFRRVVADETLTPITAGSPATNDRRRQTIRRDRPQRLAARLHEPSERQAVDAVVLISGGVITAAGSRLAMPPGASVIDVGGATLMPGLIDAHTHLMARFGDGPND